ncbi:MAG: alpha/beta hydrolase [Saprospiraceae bacterium]|nr:alpha/beta hydrolase [Saprospiraceae bacterium]
MKKLIPILLVFVIASCQKEDFSADLTEAFSIESTSSGANYPIKVALPENYSPETQTYATIYVLDGEQDFDFVAENCKKISNEFSTSNVLVVSIGYGNDRVDDYTPTKAKEGGGGAEKFMQFIENELIPRIESNYAVDTLRSSRTILGHSFGGLLGAYAFTNHNSVFGNYLMLSPSIWYDNEIMLRLEQENRNINSNNHQLVYLGLGQLENEGRMFAPFEAFHQRLQNYYDYIAMQRHIEQHLDHMGSKNPNILKGLNFYFKFR